LQRKITNSHCGGILSRKGKGKGAEAIRKKAQWDHGQ